MKFQKIDSFRKGIVFSSGFNIASKLLLFGQNVILAYLFGANAKVDVFFYAFATISLVTQSITMLNGYVLIPESMRIRKEKGLIDSMKFLNVFLYGYLLLGFLFLFVTLISPVDTFRIASNFDPKVLEEHRLLLILSIPLFLLMIVVNFLVDVLSSFRFFTAPQLAKMINSVFALIFLLAFYKILDIKSILYGYYVGYAINIIFLVNIMRKQLNWNFRMKFYRIEKRILKNSLYAQGGNLFTIMANYLPIYLLSGFSTGIISALNYGERIAKLPTNAITQQFSPVVGIKFNELYAAKNFDELNKIFIRAANTLFFILAVISTLTVLYNTEVVKILYERGAFNENATKISAEFLGLFILSIPFISINTLVSRIFMSGHKIKQYFYYQVIKNLFMLFFTYIFIKKIGVLGFPIALILVNVLNIPACYLQMWISFRFVQFKTVLIDILKILAINAICALPIFLFNHIAQDWNIYLKVICGTSIFGTLLTVSNLKTNINPDVNKYIKKYYRKFLQKSKIKTNQS